MPSLIQIAEQLAGCTSIRAAESIAGLLGFGEALPLSRYVRNTLGLDDGVAEVRVAAGEGLLRLALIRTSPGTACRIAAARAAVRLGERSPHLLWLACIVQKREHAIAITIPPASGSHRVSALVVDTRRVHTSDAETIAAMASARGSGDVLTHIRWRELLGRDSLTRRFYKELEAAVGTLAESASGAAPDAARREIALLCTSRLLFLAFLEAKGWLDGDREFLRHRFDERCLAGGSIHRRLLDPLFFGTLNTPFARRAGASRAFGRVPFLNGGLFSRSAIERRYRALTLCDDAIGTVVCDLLGRYRVTAHEESTSWNEAAVDPEMLGRAFESLMASDDRRRSGAFYTPRAILERVTAEGIEEWLASAGIPEAARAAARANEPVEQDVRPRLLSAVSGIRVLDPACGSGAFLVHALERLAEIRRAAGDLRPTSLRRRDVLRQSIFGVDVNPTAVWLCELRLWLSMVIESEDHDGLAVAPLPNLDHHVRVGDALAGHAFENAVPCDTPLTTLRTRYTRATGARKRTLARALDREERRLAIWELERECALTTAHRRDLVSAMRGRDLFGHRVIPSASHRLALTDLRTASRDLRRRLASVRAGGALPFSFRSQFADVGAAGGFDLVVGNPPWVRIHRLGPAQRIDYARRYRSWREASWTDGAADTGAGRGFAAQVDLAALFTERATHLARPGGVLSLLVPTKLWSSLAGGGIRRVLRDECQLAVLEDWSESPAAFDAVVYPSMIVARRGTAREPREVRAAVHYRDRVLAWADAADGVPLDNSAGAPWLLVPPEARRAFDLLAERGTRLARSALGRPLLGVKTGCNDAFLVTPEAGWRGGTHATDALCAVSAGDRTGYIERHLLRPALRGEHIRPWVSPPSGDAILFAHGADGAPLPRIPLHATRWLASWRRELDARTDAARTRRWWSLFRTESAHSDQARVVWSDISRVPRATVLEAGDDTVALNSCYAVCAPSLDDALAFAALLNSPIAAAWLCALAEPARGGYRRFLGWTLGRFPIPSDWPAAVDILAPLAQAARDGNPPGDNILAAAVARAYHVRLSRLEPLMTWCLR